ncbi:MlaD family protein [Paraliomyxa miuraensis]|uniref:MlaD family protein n=1 Tax=Paraliomyxa miuraensis TaxID=376150 RepID=UPI00225BBD55|nr:MlaD family protein [Paraliomyxa miuraensis]MCX4242655.1 MlaD family protein [Paraliomyxa miuraensis]
MSIPFRVRRAEWVAGAFLLLAVIGLVGSLVLLSRAGSSFEATVRYDVVLTDGYGITPGGRVEMLGIDIGSIETLAITDDNRVTARLEIRERFATRVREGSVARVKASLDLQGVLGGVGLAVTPGPSDGAPLPEGSLIPVDEPNSFADLLPVVPGDPLVEDLEALLHNARKLSDALADPESPLRTLLDQSGKLLAAVQDEQSSIGRILKDDGQLYERLMGTLDDVEGSLERLEKVLARSGRLIGSADGMIGKGAEVMDEAGGMVEAGNAAFVGMAPVLDSTDAAMKELDEAVRAFAKTTRELQKVVEALGPLVEDMDEMVNDMDDVAEAAKKMWVLRRHARKAERQAE